MNFKEYYFQLNEVHFGDVFPKAFSDFHNKWKKFKNDSSLYVRFDNGQSMDSLGKGVSSSPDHKDMVGTYAYPLKYVIDHAGDIWYGHNSKYLKVLKDKSKTKLVLSNLDKYMANHLLRKNNLPTIEDLKGYFPDREKGSTSAGKMFMTSVQMDFSEADDPRLAKKKHNRGEDVKKPKVRTGLEQSKILLKMGIDAIEDRAKNISQASINDREPEQICFLTPRAYEIVETFRMSDPEPNRSNVVFDEDRLKRKIAANISSIINDKLISTDGYNKFWTKLEREIEVKAYDASLEYRMKNLKMGQKQHKMFKKTDKTAFNITLKSERGDFKFEIYSIDKVDDVLNKFSNNWNSNPDIDNGNRYSKEKFEQQEKEKRFAESEKIRKKLEDEAIGLWNVVIVPKYNSIAKKLGLSEIPNTLSDKEILHTYKSMENFSLDIEKLKDIFEYTNVDIVKDYRTMLDYMKKHNIHISKNLRMNIQDLYNALGGNE